MAVFRDPSTKTWILLYVFFPLMPFLLGTMIRLIVSSGRLLGAAFSASELAICFALLSLFINQNLLRTEGVLDNEDKEEDVKRNALLLLSSAIFFIVLFALIITCDIAVNFHNLEPFKGPLLISQIIVFCATPFILYWTISIQRSFRLRAHL
jgi:hypothetical protein